MTNKWIITGDVHIHRFTEHNVDDFRLKQFVSLAKRLVVLGRHHKAKTIVLSGDTIHVAQHEPKVSHTVREFFNILTKGFDRVFYIFGQHDLNSKSKLTDNNFVNSIVPVIGYDAKYMHKEIINESGRRITFKDWEHTHDVSWIEDKVDLLISHVTIHDRFGQDIDQSKFDLGFAGDIHTPTNIGNLHSTNVPMPNGISDNQDGSVVLLDVESMKWERVATECGDFQYLKFFYADSIPKEYENYPNLAIRERTLSALGEDGTSSIVHLNSLLDIKSVIETCAIESRLEETHKKHSALITYEDSLLSFDFKLIDVRVKNFRSIDDFHYEFSNGLLYLYGMTGSGKSSLIRALIYCLVGGDEPRLNIRTGADYIQTEVNLEYEGKRFNIKRSWQGSGSFTYFIDGVEATGGSIRARQENLYAELPFLNHLGIIYRDQKAPPLLSQYGFSDRINLISSILNLGIINEYLDYSIKEVIKYVSQLATHNDESIRLDAIIKSLTEESINTVKQEPDLLLEISSINSELEELGMREKVANRLSTLLVDIAKAETLFNKCDILTEEELSSLNEETDSIKSDISELRTTVSEIDKAVMVSSRSVGSLTESYRAGKKKLESYLADLASHESGSVSSCVLCGSALDQSSSEKHINELKPLIEVAKSEIEAIKIKIEKETISNTENLDLKREAEEYLKSINESLSKVTSKIRDHTSSIKSKNYLDELNASLSKYDTSMVDVIRSTGTHPDINNTQVRSLQSQLTELNKKLGAIDEIKKTIIIVEAATNDLENLTQEIQQVEQELANMRSYRDMFTASGMVTASVFNKIADLMSTDLMKINTLRQQVNGDTKIDFSVELKVGTKYVPYDGLSGGQTNLADILFINRLINLSGGSGLLILDEALKNLDVDTLEQAIDVIEASNVRTTVLVTHVPTFQRYTHRLGVTLNGDVSQYSIN